MTIQPRGIIRLGYVHVAVDGDMDKLREFYRQIVGLVEMETSDSSRLYFRCWHEAFPYSLVIEKRAAAELVEIGFELSGPDDLDLFLERLSGCDVPATRQDPGVGVGPSLVVTIPGGIRVRLFVPGPQELAYMTGHRSPDWVTPRSLRATAAPLSLNHVGITVPNPAETVEFLNRVLGFVVSERIESDDGRQLISALLFRMCKDVGGQELAIFQGDEGRLHHIAFTKEDYNDILLDGHYLAEARVRLDPIGPTRQSYGKTFSLFFFDPEDIRLELCSGGRITEAHPDFVPVVWKAANLRKALSFYDSDVSSDFLQPCL